MNKIAQSLSDRIKNKEVTIAVMGLGYVGLNVSLAFAESGFKVYGFDIDPIKINQLKKGINYIKEEKRITEVLPKVLNRTFFPSSDVQKASHMGDVIIIIVPTADGDIPTLNHLNDALKSVMKNSIKGKLIIIESTVKVGTTENFVKPLLETTGLVAGEDFFLAYSPERIDPGNTTLAFHQIPKVIGGIEKESAALASFLYHQVIEEVVIVSNPRTAEFVKLMENTQRDTNIALINLFALMCEKANIDIEEALFAASTKWNFHVYRPGCGVGGHCLKKDPVLLLQSFSNSDLDLTLIKAARKVNDLMPLITAEKLRSLCIDKLGMKPEEVKVGILGMSYKKNSSDIRNSPSQFIIQHLEQMGIKDIFAYDPLARNYPRQSDLKEVLRCPFIIYAVDHDAFKGLLDDYDGYVIDGTNTLDPSTKVIGIGRYWSSPNIQNGVEYEDKIVEEKCEAIELKATEKP